MTSIRVLAVIVLPPHLQVSGAARAGERLSYELAGFDDIDIEIANMAGRVGEHLPSSDIDTDTCIEHRRPTRRAVRTMTAGRAASSAAAASKQMSPSQGPCARPSACAVCSSMFQRAGNS